jgi:hypothetical protein
MAKSSASSAPRRNVIAYNKTRNLYLISKKGHLFIKDSKGKLRRWISEEDGLPSGFERV